jgi:tetratricopeptide (TPR) repeat protein
MPADESTQKPRLNCRKNAIFNPVHIPSMIQKPAFKLILAILISSSAYSQKIDSLETALNTVTGDKKVKTLNELFRAYLDRDPVKALGFTREALNLATEIDDKRGQAASYNNLGVAYRNQGALDKALEYYLTSMKLYETLNNKEGIATTKNNIANIYSIKKDYAQAMRYLEDSYNLFTELRDEPRIIGSMNNLGNLYSDIQLFEKAQKYLQQAYQLSEKSGQKFADPLNNLGNIYYKQGNYEKAIEFYLQAFEIEKASNNRLGMLNVVTNLGITYTKARKTKDAQQYLNEAEKLCHELQAFTSLPAIYKSMAENASSLGKWKDAYDMQVKYDEEREKIYGEESSRNIAQMEMVIDFQQKERELADVKKEAEIRTLELRNSRLFIILVILGVIVVLALFNLFYLDRKKRLISP